MASLSSSGSDIETLLGSAEVGRILGVHSSTVQRRRASGRKPSPFESQRREKLHRIWEQLLVIYTPDHAIDWLHSTMPALGEKRPLDIMAEDGGWTACSTPWCA